MSANETVAMALEGSTEPTAHPFALPEDFRKLLARPARSETVPELAACFRQEDLRLVYLNEPAQLRLDPEGRAPSVRLTLPDLIGVSSLQRLQGQILPQVKVLGRWSGECEMRDVWGGEFPVTVMVAIQRERPGGPSYIVLHAQERLASKQGAARFSDRQLLHAMLEHARDGVYFKDTASRYLRLSRTQAKRLQAEDAAAVIGRTDFDFLPTERAGQGYCQDQDVIRSGQPLSEHEEHFTLPDGKSVWLAVTKVPLYDAAGNPIGIFGRERDITARKQRELEKREMETQLQLANKMQSIGQLAAGVAHEINTPTQFITDNTHFLRDSYTRTRHVLQAARELRQVAARFPECAQASEALRMAEEAAELDYLASEVPRCIEQSLDGLARVARIVCSLKEFAHPNSPELAPVDLNHTIETSITVSRHEWKYVAELEVDFDPTLPPVPCVVDEFNQVMLNLIINAAHAIGDALRQRKEERGRITVRTRRERDWAIVEVADTGTGVPEALREKIFEPFFTTKPVGKGTGQGLAIVRSVIVNHHQGQIDLRSEPGQGTTFVLRLPLQAPKKKADAAPAPQAPSP